ncbi:hypothetical protein [Frateuria sp. Soil773]|uniref:hypothetical protein n=1 Tax=Frateuria sp. Soil773 TaxID=1736407 RepID=UPI0012FBE775|nr:hypothetical protein [Frateuria sp. Soil773]
MFGWLATFGVCDRMRSVPASVRWLRMSPQGLAQRLPSLGSVLYLARREGEGAAEAVPAAGVLAESMDLTPLLHTHWLHAASTVTAEGPREWIECRDARGETLARLYLLPDTDYLAWDALLGDGTPCPAPALRERRARFHAMRARLLCFSHRRLAGLSAFGCAGAPRISPIGRRLAQDIARSEAVALDAVPACG